MNITNLALNKYIQIKATKDPQCLIEDSYELAKEEILSLIGIATKVYHGHSITKQEIDIYVFSPFVLVVATESDVIIDVTFIDLKLNPEFTDAYVNENVKELTGLNDTLNRLVIENAEKDKKFNLIIKEKNDQIDLLKDQIKKIETEREVYTAKIAFNKQEIKGIQDTYKTLVAKFTGVKVL